jgi:hypothetical protein
MRANILLALGILAGIFLASTGILEQAPSLGSNDAIAKVNGISLSRDQYQSLIKNIEDNKQNPLTEEHKKYLLQRMIDEELMVQRGQEIGLLELNSILRNNIRQALVETIIAENAVVNQDRSSIEAFYKENADFFSQTSKLRVKHLKFENEKTAQQAFDLLKQGQAFAEVKTKYALPSILEVPDSLLSLADLQKYLGPTLTETLAESDTQGYSEPIEAANQWHIALVLERKTRQAPTLDSVYEQVSKEYQRRQNELAVRQYVDWLRDRADIELYGQE